jgi:macrodomain Ter protein organizer (MatP/YcbG family)
MMLSPNNGDGGASPRLEVMQRKPKRISITLAFNAWHQLVNKSDYEGRSVSNLAAYLIETGLNIERGQGR